ncbi:GIY-YIG nuclease family protein [Prochlorococcus marinus]|uniref:GIY-YIG nuclease family protein n=1 Tax=Prochlorococcus marinus TaxID=1219 RepID=UPI0022B4B3D9|nr:GIY-YIG nuclease family protein [Prochlorococcus marinus]
MKRIERKSKPRKWTHEIIQKEALKYDRRSDFEKGTAGAYQAALKLGIIDQVCAHMPKGSTRKWDAKSIKEEALKYDSRGKFQSGCRSAYGAARKLGIIDDICEHMPKRESRKWDEKSIREEALKFDRRKDFAREFKGAVRAAYKLGIMDEICSHMKPKFSEKWDPESIKQEALKYNGRKKFQKGAYGAYKAAKRYGIVDEVCAHMKSIYWTKSMLMEVAKQYKSLKKFRTEKKGAYLYACKNGYLTEVVKKMDRLLVPHGYWTIEKCKEKASKYHYRNEFQKEFGSAYNAALKNGWLDEICSHMKSHADGYNHCIYVILNKRKNLAYVGITRQLFNARMEGHKSENNTASSKAITNLKDTEFIQLTDYLFDSSQVKEAEFKWFKKYQRKGFILLNDEKQLGRTGTDRRIHTDEIIFAEAKKYATRGEFKKKSPRIYDAACTQRLLDKACTHMRSIEKAHTWKKKKIVEFARSCTDRSEFVDANNGAYDAARRNGYLEEIYKFLRSKDDMSWSRPSTRKEIWCFADQYFDIWIENEQCGMWRMRTLTNLNLDKMIQKFRRGWIPAEDQEWKAWAEGIKSQL